MKTEMKTDRTIAWVAYLFLVRCMRRTALLIAAAFCFLLSSACERARKPHLPRYEMTYYDRNHDGIVDFEFHHAPGWADADWGFVDSDYNAEYDILFGPGTYPPIKVHVPVPGGVPITKKLPKELQGFK